MSCDEHQQNISKLLDGMLDKDQTPGVFAHLGGCEECREFFQLTLGIRQAMRAAPPVSLPENFEAIVRSIGGVRQGFAPDRVPVALAAVHKPIRLRVSTVALLLLMLFLGALLFSTKIELQPLSEYTTMPSMMR